jgi:hypothetical protein
MGQDIRLDVDFQKAYEECDYDHENVPTADLVPCRNCHGRFCKTKHFDTGTSLCIHCFTRNRHRSNPGREQFVFRFWTSPLVPFYTGFFGVGFLIGGIAFRGIESAPWLPLLALGIPGTKPGIRNFQLQAIDSRASTSRNHLRTSRVGLDVCNRMSYNCNRYGYTSSG